MERNSNKLFSFLLNDRFRVYRQLLIIFIVIVFTRDFVWHIPEELAPISIKISGWIIYTLLFTAVIFTNIYVLIPRLFFKKKTTLYFFSLLLITLVTFFGLVIVQGYLFDAEMSQQLSPLIGLLRISAIMVILGLMLAGTTVISLFRQRIEDNLRINELESTTLKSELGLLKNQINPHFLFNMLNNANMLLDIDGAKASEVIFKLEDLLRYQINDCAKDCVPLSSDIRFINDFLNLEKMRRDNFEYTLDRRGDIEHIEVAPLLFISFVENAVKHSPDSENPSYINILFKENDNRLEFICENSISQIKTANQEGCGLGLKNIKRRLELLYPNCYKLDIIEEKTRFYVKLELAI